MSIVCTMSLFFAPKQVYAEITSDNVAYYLEGAGTKTEPYQIASVEDLIAFRNLVNSGYNFQWEYVCQTADLDLRDITQWKSIGYIPMDGFTDSNCAFYGTYDGQGHTISNLQAHSYEYVGLFGALGGTIMNLGIESGNVNGMATGVLVNTIVDANANIWNCYNKADATGLSAGGIIYNFAGGEIANCWSIGTVLGDTCGGIASEGAGRMTNCFAEKKLVSSMFAGESVEGVISERTEFESKEMTEILNERLQELQEEYKGCHFISYTYDEKGGIHFSGPNIIVEQEKSTNDLGIWTLTIIGGLVLLACVLLLIMCFVKPGKRGVTHAE